MLLDFCGLRLVFLAHFDLSRGPYTAEFFYLTSLDIYISHMTDRTLRLRGRGSGAHQNGSIRVRSEVHEAGHTPLADRQPEPIDIDDDDYFDELDSPNVI